MASILESEKEDAVDDDGVTIEKSKAFPRAYKFAAHSDFGSLTELLKNSGPGVN